MIKLLVKDTLLSKKKSFEPSIEENTIVSTVSFRRVSYCM